MATQATKPDVYIELLKAIADRIEDVDISLSSKGTVPMIDNNGGRVGCLIEAVISVSVNLGRIADTLDSIDRKIGAK